jgi:superfamily II DNA or RNA helicase
MEEIMSIRDIKLKKSYHSSLDRVARDFYIPLLSEAHCYKRAVGFFSSSIFSVIAVGIASLAKNGGFIQLVASPKLSAEDITAIQTGYALRDEIARNAVLRELSTPKNQFEEKNLNLLANLITKGIMDIKIALTENATQAGMFHVKMGLVEDTDGNVVAFSGSMNESLIALELNYESIDVYCSWQTEDEQTRTIDKMNQFASIWNNTEPNVRIVEFPALEQEILNRYMRKSITDFEESVSDEKMSFVYMKSKRRKNVPAIPPGVLLHNYQTEAIDEWVRRDYRGIFDMATGTGKTFTGLGAIARLYEAVDGKLAVIIVCPYQHLVEQWVEDIKLFGIKPIIGYSSSSQKDWLKRLESAILNQILKVTGREFFCFICTNATFSSDKVQGLIAKIRGEALLLVDEAHNFGAERLSCLMSDRYDYRLALSATIKRHNDEEGTAKLYSYFGSKCIEYTLECAIAENKLTRYKYYPIITTLNDNENRIYIGLTIEMSKCLIKGKDEKTRLNERGKRIALKRARLVAGIEDKLTKLAEHIKPYIDDKHILVYCGATTVLRDDRDRSDTGDEDLRQIDAVTQLLGNVLNMKISQFTSKEDIAEREILKREFAAGDNLQALIAIKCLDEGVNIPAIKTAFILASTTNPKEYIQRRGRVLRLFPGKEYAEIFDFIALPRPLDEVASLTDEQVSHELTLVKNELARAEEFARLAMNMGEAEKMIDAIKEAYSINDYEITFEEDYGYDE